MGPSATTPPWFRWVLRALVVAPMVVAAARAVANGWFPVGDAALLSIRAFDVGTEHHPMLGSWTSASLTLGTDVNNPGPLYHDLLAPFTWTLGRWVGIGPAIAVGVATVNAVAALGTVAVGHRLGGWRAERWCLLLVAALAWAMGSELLIDIWQPHALLLPFVCFLVLTVGLVDGHWTLAPWWLAVASLIVQTHIGYVYVLAVFGVLAVTVGVAEVGRREVPLAALVRHRSTVVGAVVVALLWLQPILEQLFGDGRGNLARLAANAGGGEVTIGSGTAIKLVAQVVAVPPWWTRYGFEDSVMSTPLTDGAGGPELSVPGLPPGPIALVLVMIVVAALGWLAVLLRRHSRTTAAAGALVAAVGVAAGVATLSIQTVSVVGLGSHHVRWLFVLSLFVQVIALWSAVELGALGRSASAADYVAAVLVVGLVGANLGFHAHDLGPTADREAAATLEGTFDDLAAFDPGGSVRYEVDGLRPFEAWSSAVQMRMRELDLEFRVADEGVVRQLGNGRRADGTEVTTIRQVERGAALGFDGPGCVISRSNPLDPEEASQVDASIDAAVADLAAGRVEVDASGLDDDLPRRFAAATTGDTVEARILVADGLLPFLAGADRIGRSTPAVDAVIADAERIARRVEGTLLLVTDPPVGCRESPNSTSTG